MSDKFKDINPKRSIRDIPIPNKTERAELEAEAIREDEETAADNIQDPNKVAIHHPAHTNNANAHSHRVAHDDTTDSHTHRMDGMKASTKTTKKVAATAPSSTRAKKTTEATQHVTIQREPAFLSNSDIDLEDDRVSRKFSTESTDDTDDNVDSETFDTWNKKHKKGYMFWFLCIAAVVLVFVLISTYFASATVTISPKKYAVTLDSTKLYLSDVPHKTTEVSADTSLQVAAKGTVKVDRKATGRIVIYNTYNSVDQKLIAGTRVETSDGKIFRLKNPVTVPGQKTSSAGKKIAGSAEVDIVADVSGDNYNVGFKDFKISAYKGTDKDGKIYGRSKTSIDGGYVGEVPNISQTNIASSSAILKSVLAQKLEENIIAAAGKYKDYSYVPHSYVATFDPVTQKTSADGTTVTLSGKAKATTVLFEKKSLSKEILKAENMIHESTTTAATATSSDATSTDDTPVITPGDTSKIAYTGDISMIQANFPKDTIVSDLTSNKNVYFTVTGTSTLYSSVDENTLAMAISHLTKSQAIPVVKQLVDSDEIQISIWPWWKSTLPTVADIKIVIK